jgi:hypothetical protein
MGVKMEPTTENRIVFLDRLVMEKPMKRLIITEKQRFDRISQCHRARSEVNRNSISNWIFRIQRVRASICRLWSDPPWSNSYLLNFPNFIPLRILDSISRLVLFYCKIAADIAWDESSFPPIDRWALPKKFNLPKKKYSGKLSSSW